MKILEIKTLSGLTNEECAELIKKRTETDTNGVYMYIPKNEKEDEFIMIKTDPEEFVPDTTDDDSMYSYMHGVWKDIIENRDNYEIDDDDFDIIVDKLEEELAGMTCLPACGHFMRIDYHMEGNELVSTGVCEVEFKEVTNEMDMNLEAAATNVETPAIEETTAIADSVATLDTVEPAVEGAEEDKSCAECGNPEDGACDEPEKAAIENDIDDDLKDMSDDDAEDLEEMRRELEQAKAELAQYKEAEEKAKLAEKREAARKYAEREHLNLESESVKTAIENADYEALAAEVMAKPVENKDEETYRVVAEMSVSPFGNMFDKAN